MQVRVRNNDLVKKETDHFVSFIPEWGIAQPAPPKAAGRDRVVSLVLRRWRRVGQAWGEDGADPALFAHIREKSFEQELYISLDK